ncbi:MAG: alpha-galactosidase [Victivallales bacterium]|nr:alpha-galactosidase [Victivallales bacterium]
MGKPARARQRGECHQDGGNAAKIGTELFVIDDGWQHALGDWYPDPVKFPNGLRPVVERVAQLGMKFGLWVEPESFELASDLYREHPEWVMAYPGIAPTPKRRGDVPRESVMLNLARKDVAEYLYRSLHKLIQDTGIAYLKLDMNTYFIAPGGVERLWIDYARNLDWVFQTLSKDFPGLLLENCASGGARVSLQMTRAFGRINRSDNQDPLDMLRLHEGFTYLNLPRMAGGACHISDSMQNINLRQAPLSFQAFAGMLGDLACGKNLIQCTDQELADIRSYVDLFKKFRPILHLGTFYRLASINEGPYAAYEYLAPDKSEALLFVFGHGLSFGEKIPPIRVVGLDPDAMYQVDIYGVPEQTPQNKLGQFIWQGGPQTRPLTGRSAMQTGFAVTLAGDYDARVLHLHK